MKTNTRENHLVFERLTFFAFVVIFLFQQACAFAAGINGTTRSSMQGNSNIMKPITYSENFEEGNTDGWESYPPFQDTGFDPDLYCQRINGPNGSKYSLMFEYRPTFITEHEIGFIRKLSLVAAAGSTVSFYYKANGYGDFKGMELILYGSDGKQYCYHDSINDDSEWHFLHVSIQDFKYSDESIQTGTGIKGFSVTTYIPRTNPDITYRIYLDGLNIDGLSPVKFQLEEPASEYLKNLEMIIPLHHYHFGEKFRLSVSSPKNVVLKSVQTTLINPEGGIAISDVPLQFNRSDGRWRNDDIHTFTDKDPLGQWTVRIAGENGAGEEVETDFKIWLTQNHQPHPRMYFTNEEEIDQLKEKIDSKDWKGWWDALVRDAAKTRDSSNVGSIKFGAETSSLREVHPGNLSLESLSKVDLTVNDSVFLLPTLSHYFGVIQSAMKILQENALIYALTGDTAAGNFAKEALIIIAGWKTWNHPWFAARHRETYYPVGELGVRAAFCYDVVYPLMTKKERDEVGEGLLRNCIIPAYKEYVLHDRVPSATSNWVGNTVSGGISCALAIYGDDPKLGDLEPYLSGLIGMLRDYIHNTLDTTGAWGEGIGYQGFAYSNVLPTLSVIKNVLHLDLSSKGLFNSYKYFLYNFSNPHTLDVGDSHPELSTLSEFAWLSSHSNDPVFQWLYMQSPRKDIFDFMFGTNKGPETPPTSFPKSIEFPELGAVVFRSGWSPDDIVMNFRCGHFYNHQHYDQGSFQLNAYGVSLIPEAGWANYYNDPWYRRYYIQPVGHNTLLLDEDAGSQESGDYLHFIKAADRSAKITDFITTDSYSSTTGELANLYYGKLSLFERNIIFMHRRYFVIYDRVKSSKVPHEYDLLFHFNDLKEVSLKSKNTFTFRTDSASLYSQVVFPDKPKLELFDGPIHFGVPIKRPGYVQVSNSAKSMGENFVTVLYPVKGDRNITSVSKDIERLKGQGYIGLRVENDKEVDVFLFKTWKANMNGEGISTDGRIAEITLNHNMPSHFAANEASYLSYKGEELIKASTRVTFSGRRYSKGEDWQINTKRACKVNLQLPFEPKEIRLNGTRLMGTRIIGRVLDVVLPAGNDSLEIRP